MKIIYLIGSVILMALVGCSNKQPIINTPYTGFIIYDEIPKVKLTIKKNDINSYKKAIKQELILIRKLRLQNEAYKKQILNYIAKQNKDKK